MLVEAYESMSCDWGIEAPGGGTQFWSMGTGRELLSTVVMSWMLDLFLSFFPEFWRRKYFWAWLATWVGVLVTTTFLEMLLQSPFPNLLSPIRNSLCHISHVTCHMSHKHYISNHECTWNKDSKLVMMGYGFCWWKFNWINVWEEANCGFRPSSNACMTIKKVLQCTRLIFAIFEILILLVTKNALS